MIFKKSMPVTKNASLRHRLIDECLQRRQQFWTPARLLETVADKFWQATGQPLSKRQFAQDLADMKEGGSAGYNAPLEWTRAQGYHYTDPTYSIYNSPLVSEDADVLRQALAMLQQFQGLGLGDELTELVQRVENHLQARPAPEPTRQFISFEQVPDYVGTRWLGALYQAIRGRQVLALRYRPFGAAEAEEITVQPYLLKQYNHRWFLVGQGSGRPGLSIFALDRIEATDPDPTPTYLSPPADLSERFAHVVGVSVPAGAGPPELVRLRFGAGRGPYVRTKPMHASQQVAAETPDTLEITLRVVPTPELETLLLSFGNDVEVLAPATLRKRLGERLQTAAARYA